MGGVNAFTLATMIAALICGAGIMGGEGQSDIVLFADDWNARIEEWCTGTNPELAARFQCRAVLRARRARRRRGEPGRNQRPCPHSQPPGEFLVPADTMIATDFLQLVRFGLRLPDDPAIDATLKLTNALLRVDTPSGPSWHRYNGDGYGEQADGSPYNGSGIGRAWPLLTGERGHYELAAGRDDEAQACCVR